MRFRIKFGWKASEPYRFYLDSTLIPVRRAKRSTHHELSWTWQDGTIFTLMHPLTDRLCLKTIVRGLWWRILAGDQTVCSGRMIHPPLRHAIFRAALPRIEWELAGEVVVDESGWGCCGGALRQANGRRLAVWHRGFRFIEVVCRDKLPHSLAPVILGMILADLYDPG
jgi:hypothetical protein